MQGIYAKVKAITEELCGHEFSSSTIGRIVRQLHGKLKNFANRRSEEPYPYLVLDARYARRRSRAEAAVLVAIGMNWEDKRSVLAVVHRSKRFVRNDPSARTFTQAAGWSKNPIDQPQTDNNDAKFKRALGIQPQMIAS